MNLSPPDVASFFELLDRSRRPVYAVDAERRIVYCNSALAEWIGDQPAQIAGRYVEYHSEPSGTGGPKSEVTGPLVGLCPAPAALAGVECSGTVSSQTRERRLLHRRADFVPLPAGANPAAGHAGQPTAEGNACGVLVVLATADMTPQELSHHLTDEPSVDELHRAIRSFRRTQSRRYAIAAVLGESVAIRKVRAQATAAAATRASVLIRGRPNTGRGDIARAIHYHGGSEAAGTLVPIDCAVMTEEMLRRALEAVRAEGDIKRPATLLLENLEQLPATLQSKLAHSIGETRHAARFVATVDNTIDRVASNYRDMDDQRDADRFGYPVDPALVGALSTLVIDVPRLVDRIDDLPLLAQAFIESCNRDSSKQIGGLTAEAIDLLALYSWPGELEELRRVVTAGHQAATTHEITVSDLPTVLHHAAHAAEHVPQEREAIQLDALLASIETELIQRALALAGGNKSEAARLLGMSRPRLYRRLVQLGLAGAAVEDAL